MQFENNFPVMKSFSREGKKMHKVKADTDKNMLYVFCNNSKKMDMRKFVAEIEEACYALPYGFSCILVLSKNTATTEQYKWMIYYTENLLYAYGLSKIVIVKEQEHPFLPSGCDESYFPLGFQIENASTIQEAERILSSR